MLRMGTPKLHRQILPAASLPREPIGAPPLIQGGRRGRALQTLVKFEGPLHQNPWAHAPPSQRSHLGLLFLSLSLRLGPAHLLGANPKLGRPRWTYTNGPVASTLGIGDPRFPGPDSHCHQAATRAHWAPPLIQVVRKGRALLAHGDLPRPPGDKALGPTLPLLSALTSAHPSIHCTAIRSFLPASWGLTLTLTLGLPWRGPSQGAGADILGLGDPQAPVPDSPC